MGLVLLKTSDCNLIYEFNKGTTLSIQVIKSEKRPKKAVIQPLKVVLVEQGSTITTHIYRSRENFRLNKKTKYDKVNSQNYRETRAALWTLRNWKNSKKWNGL